MNRSTTAGVVLSCLLTGLFAAPVFAATITVTNTSDSGAGSLRDAIANASAGDTITFALPLPATITLGSVITIGTALTIAGPGAGKLAISGNHSVGVFNIVGSTVSISRLTIKDGFRAYADYGSAFDIWGGAILNYFGNLTLTECTISGNQAAEGGGIHNDFATLTVTDCDFINNAAVFGSGGGIDNYFGTLTVTGSTFAGNSANNGGAVANVYGTFSLSQSTVTANTAQSGGAFFSATMAGTGRTTLANSTMFANSASYSGGGIYARGTLSLSNVTLAGNISNIIGGDSGGGGFFLESGATLTAKNSLFARGAAGENCGLSVFTHNGVSNVVSLGHNLSDDASCGFNAAGDWNVTAPGLDPAGLAGNDGRTKTVALQAGSPAVDAVPISDCTLADGITPVAVDQRGGARPHGAGCDIGAFELGATITRSTSTTIASSMNPSVLGQSVTFTAVVSASAPAGGTVTFRDGATVLGTATLFLGQAQLTTNALGVGTHAITADYDGAAGFLPSSGGLTQQVSFGLCVLSDPTKAVHSGAVTAIKVKLCNVNGGDISGTSGIVLHATAVTMQSTFVGAPQSPGNSNPNDDFRADGTGFIFNLSTHGLSPGSYLLHFTATGDPVPHAVGFGVD